MVSLLFTLSLLSGCNEATNVNTQVSDPIASPWAAVLKGYVNVEGGVISIAAPRQGIVQAVLVEEGSMVKQGDLLAQMEDDEARAMLAIAQHELYEAQTQIDLLLQKIIIAQREQQRTAQLSGHVIPQKERDLTEDQVVIAKKELAQKRAVAVVLNAKINAAQIEVDKHQVRAPVNGLIVKRDTRPGEGTSITTVTPLFKLAPNTERIIRAELEDLFVKDVQPGQLAEVRLENDDETRYPAKVLRLGQVFGERERTDDPNTQQDRRIIECVLAIDAPNLRIGQRVMVYILPEKQEEKLIDISNSGAAN